tara:strand:+ start:148 stop:726 length:579 start_codon:yes stop_codon:yes gene_type:complete
MNNFSDKYFEIINKYKDFHENGIGDMPASKTFEGTSLAKWIVIIKKFLIKYNCKSIIDFGCGKAIGYTTVLDIEDESYKGLADFWNCQDIVLYDPAVEIYKKYPSNKADCVICVDVLEHIPPNDLLSFIDDLFRLSKKLLFICVATIPATKFFEDGSNIHLSIKSENQWIELFNDFKIKYPSITLKLKFNEN